MHHIRTFATEEEQRYFLGNLVTLCNKCHNKTKGREAVFENYFYGVRTQTLLFNFEGIL